MKISDEICGILISNLKKSISENYTSSDDSRTNT